MQRKYSVCFVFAQVKICLISTEYNPLIWCLNYFQGYIKTVDPDVCSGDINIELISNQTEFAINKYEHVATNSNIKLKYDALYKNYLVYFTNTNELEKEFMRLVRNIILNKLENRNFIFLHAACVASLGNGIAIIGPKFSGKTTMCLSFLNQGFDFVTNDKLAMRINKNKFDVYGLPVSVGIRAGTRNLFQNIDFNGGITVPYEDKTFLTPTQCCDKFQCEIASCAELRMFIIPKISENISTLSICELSAAEKEELIEQQIIASVYESYRFFNKKNIHISDEWKDFKKRLAALSFLCVESNGLLDKEIFDYIKKALGIVL